MEELVRDAVLGSQDRPCQLVAPDDNNVCTASSGLLEKPKIDLSKGQALEVLENSYESTGGGSKGLGGGDWRCMLFSRHQPCPPVCS